MALTLAEVREKLLGTPEHDPIANSLDEITEEDGKIVVTGIDDETSYRDFLMFEQNGDKIRLMVRAPNDDVWDSHGSFDNFKDLHTWVYEL